MTIPWWYWPLGAVSYLFIGAMLGSLIHWSFWRHVARVHPQDEKTSDGRPIRGFCWCQSQDMIGDFILISTWIAPIIWPVVLVLYAVIQSWRPWLLLRGRIRDLACWSGKVENAHPEAKPITTKWK